MPAIVTACFLPAGWAGACGLRRPERHEVKTPSPRHFPSPTPALPVAPITSSVRVSSVGSFSLSPPPLRTNMNLSGASPSPASSSDLLGLQESLGRGPACQDLLLVLPCRDSEHVGSKAQRSAAGRRPRLWGHHLPSPPLSFPSHALPALTTTRPRVASESSAVIGGSGVCVYVRTDSQVLPSIGREWSAPSATPGLGPSP